MQRQQQLELDRATSGCLGLWTPPPDGTSTRQQQQQQPQQAAGATSLPPTHLFSVSAGVCPAIYFLGRYSEGRFDLAASDGPHALDLGDVVYAPNLLQDAQVCVRERECV